MKPDTTTAMRRLIQQVRDALPFDHPEAMICAGPCKGCPQKLLEYMVGVLDDWEYRLDQGEIPTFGDLDKLAKSAKKIYRVMQQNGLLGDDGAE